MKLNETAEWMNMRPATLSQLVKSGSVPCAWLGRKIMRFHKQTIIDHFNGTSK